MKITEKSCRIFISLLIVNILSNSAYFNYSFGFWPIICVLGLSSILSFCETLFVKVIRFAPLHNIVWGGVIIFHELLFLIDLFLIIYFNKVFDAVNMELMIEADQEASMDFIQTYFNSTTFSLFLFAILLFFLLFKIKIREVPQCLYLTLISCSATSVFYPCYGIIKGDGSKLISQFCAPCRFYLGATFYGVDTVLGVDKIKVACSNVQATIDMGADNLDVVVIIGESYSKYRCPLYGYEKETAPFLTNLKNSDDIIVFSNCIAKYDVTFRNMAAIYSFCSTEEDFPNKTLFPICFRKAGFYTSCYDNQYIANGVMVQTDPMLSSMMFDFRNEKRMGHDMNLVDMVNPGKTPSLTLIHLNGQHYNYENRYPESFCHFDASDYNHQIPLEQRIQMAYYDNATLYNDFVISNLLRKYKDRNCIAFYFSDHGEEVYELRDFMGHGTAESSPNPHFQLDIPFFVWCSKEFKLSHPEVVAALLKAQDYPITTNDISHVLIDVAKINTKDFDPSRSFINNQYNISRSRNVLGDTKIYESM